MSVSYMILIGGPLSFLIFSDQNTPNNVPAINGANTNVDRISVQIRMLVITVNSLVHVHIFQLFS